jgi:hypothetical protein
MGSENIKTLVKKMIRYYESTRRTDDLEPNWILYPFNLAYENKYDELAELALPDDLGDDDSIRPWQEPLFGPRVLQGGIKIGTSSWVFLGRRDSRVIQVGKWIATSRQVPQSVRHLHPITEWWALWSPTEPWVLRDRGPGPLNEIEEILDNPQAYGVPVAWSPTVKLG